MTRSITTIVAREKMVKARAGVATLPAVTAIAVGSGGIDSNGEPLIPVETQTALGNELMRKNIETIVETSSTSYKYSITLGLSDLPDTNINELALIDAEGDILAIKNFQNKFKDADSEVTFSLEDTF